MGKKKKGEFCACANDSISTKNYKTIFANLVLPHQ
jgi:hypothetical protein